jgi:hypothetical protein
VTLYGESIPPRPMTGSASGSEAHCLTILCKAQARVRPLPPDLSWQFKGVGCPMLDDPDHRSQGCSAKFPKCKSASLVPPAVALQTAANRSSPRLPDCRDSRSLLWVDQFRMDSCSTRHTFELAPQPRHRTFAECGQRSRRKVPDSKPAFRQLAGGWGGEVLCTFFFSIGHFHPN